MNRKQKHDIIKFSNVNNIFHCKTSISKRFTYMAYLGSGHGKI